MGCIYSHIYLFHFYLAVFLCTCLCIVVMVIIVAMATNQKRRLRLFMTQFQKISIFLLRIIMGWLFLYAGVTKIIDPAWSAAGYLKGAKTFIAFYHWLLSPDILPTVNVLNEWGLTLIGLALLVGIFARISAISGTVLMLLYYFSVLDFPYPNPHSYLVDEHIIYALALLLLAILNAGRVWGLDKKIGR